MRWYGEDSAFNVVHGGGCLNRVRLGNPLLFRFFRLANPSGLCPHAHLWGIDGFRSNWRWKELIAIQVLLPAR